jgi:protoporphyrinogen oxidase
MRGSSGWYYYPKYGFGVFARAMTDALIAEGGNLMTSSCVNRIIRRNQKAVACVVETTQGEKTIEFDWMFNSLPLDEQVRSIEPYLPADVVGAASDIKWRALRLVYIISSLKRHTEGPETLYFPELEFPFGRVSFPCRYSPKAGAPANESLCVEVICSSGDSVWRMNDNELADKCCAAMEKAGIISRTDVRDVFVVNLEKVYPVYDLQWRHNTGLCISGLLDMENYLPIGRMGLFSHCNIDHAVVQGITAARHVIENSPAYIRPHIMAEFSGCKVRD